MSAHKFRRESAQGLKGNKSHAPKEGTTNEASRDGQPPPGHPSRPALEKTDPKLTASGRLVGPRQLMPPFSQRPIHRMAPMKERQHRLPPNSNSLERPTYPEIPPRRYHPFLERLNRFRRPPRLVVHLRQVQIQLRVVHSHSQRFAAQRFGVAKPLLRHRRQQSRIRKVKRILRSHSQRAPGMQ